MPVVSGNITIDAVPLTSVPHEHVRSTIVAVPQEPYIFDGSVRLNADPIGSASDRKIASVLEEVKLWSLIDGRGGLDGSMEALALSQGQRVIFGVARALLRKQERGIVLFDEVMSWFVFHPYFCVSIYHNRPLWPLHHPTRH